jgi:hypothetical protein
MSLTCLHICLADIAPGYSIWVVFPVEKQSVVGVYNIMLSGWLLTESLSHFKKQLAVSMCYEVLRKLAGNMNVVTVIHILFPEMLQVAIDDAFQHSRWVN